ncbi:hypothetical protein [Pyrococcus kukulkanii]|uniref:Uncharacterized protein n=1 Tax=Pyrococcus kukulkanii TaxID=1609559 RepID=A0ABV4T514_9EURY
MFYESSNFPETYSLSSHLMHLTNLDTQIQSIEIKGKISQSSVEIQPPLGRLDKETLRDIASIVDISELSLLIKMLLQRYPKLGIPSLNVVRDPDTGEPIFIEIVFPHGSWEEWRKIVKEIKRELRSSGMESLAARVAITCLQGLKE